ncbi:MAG: hypothetical protein ABW003_28620, partial [Microvirga sp.]
ASWRSRVISFSSSESMLMRASLPGVSCHIESQIDQIGNSNQQICQFCLFISPGRSGQIA